MPDEQPEDGAPERMVWVPTSRDEFGELDDWREVSEGNAGDWDVRRWRSSP